jgi:hypothetical protein
MTKSLITCMILTASVGCSARDVTVGNNMMGSGSGPGSGSGSGSALGVNDTCTAQPPPSYLNPNNKQFVASPPTGADVLALLAGPYTGEYVPSGELSGSALTTGVQYNNGTVHCSALECSCDPPGPCSVDRCSGPYVSVDVEQRFMTADGTFNEHVASAISSPDNDGTVHFTGTLPATQLQGSFHLTLGPPSEVSLEFDGVLSGSHVTGNVDELAPTMTASGGSIQ